MKDLKLKTRPGTATYAKGQERVAQILIAARDVFMNEGYSNLTMRKIAARCGMTVGNLSYYYANKKDLLHDLLDSVLEGYMEEFDAIRADPSLSPEEQFITIIRFVMTDLTTKETTLFFPELWALANHDPQAAKGMEALYGRYRAVLKELIAQINPSLGERECTQLALFVSSSMEGHTMFIGHGKAWRKMDRNLTNIAAKAFLDVVKTITRDDIHAPFTVTPHDHGDAT